MLLELRLKTVLCAVIATLLIPRPAAADVVVPTDAVTTRVIVHATASGSSADIGSLRPGQQAELLGEVPNWYRVKLANGVEGFVSKRWTRAVSTTTPPVAPAPTTTTPSFTIDVV